ncbi:uncharacterized protein LOC132169045 [Corylus avellana]|uniref:uncharacterized protein LOC132169045 n=1 Tax=Corylus avellana TaxID=13451 RepID=UPI00286BAFC5|nr:uncharacterized protein LOC132169045 [Corylus avellana]
MGKPKTLDSFFKKKDGSQSEVSTCTHLERPLATDLEALVTNERPSKCPRIQPEEMNATFLERDLGLRPQIWEFPVNLQDDIRRAYIRAKPCQPKLSEYSYSGMGNNRRRFQASWFDTYSTWSEYSKSKDAIFCLPCYVFAKKPTGRPGSDAFTVKCLNNWKKASDEMNSSLMRHVGKDPNSPHNIAVKCCEDLMNQSGHIDKIVEKGHDESSGSKNQGNFIELVKLLESYNDDVAGLVLENAPKNAKYTSPKIQKEILHIIANKVRDAIRKEIGDAKFCILVDEARDESKREQMAIILRFVDKDGFIRERFFHIVHVKDTSASTLKKEICVVLSRYNLQIENIRGQGYDGASNMRGEWNGEAKRFHQFFIQLASIINIVGGSSKRHDDLQSIHAVELENLVASNAIETGRGINQIGTLQRPGDT